MREGIKDAFALVRCSHLAVGFPVVMCFALRRLGPLGVAYDSVVHPIVVCALSDPSERERVDSALRAASIKFGTAMLCYARLTGCEEHLDLAVLAGAVTRLYDDLIDGTVDSELDRRLGFLFKERPFEPESDLESLHGELIKEIRLRRRVPACDIMSWALNELHEWQLLSRKQRERGIPVNLLQEIQKNKGAMAYLAFCALVHEEMDEAERKIVASLGEVFQAMDDYMDFHQDKRNGIATVATLGAATLMDIGRRVCVLRSTIAARYGRRRAHFFFGSIYFILVTCALSRRLPGLGTMTRRVAVGSRATSFLSRSADAIPAVHDSGGSRNRE
jgi:hypothetical protein